MSETRGNLSSLGGIVLCGGKSRRMGYAKADLPFGEETLLQRVIRLISPACHPVVVVAAVTQTLPELPEDVLIVRDERPELGPLEGIHQGLRQLNGRVPFAYVTSCDVPFISSEFVRAVAAQRKNGEIAIPQDDRHYHPLAAVYATQLADRAADLLERGHRRPISLFEVSRVEAFPSELLRKADPELLGLMNTNDPATYRQALARGGFREPDDLKRFFSQFENPSTSRPSPGRSPKKKSD